MIRILLGLVVAILALVSVPARGDVISSKDTDRAQVQWKKFFQQVYTWNLKAQLRAQGLTPTESMVRLEKSTYYSDKDFYEVYSQIVKAPSTKEAFMLRESLLANRWDFSSETSLRSTARLDWTTTPAASIVRELEGKAQTAIAAEEYKQNYFESAMGKKVLSVLGDTLLVVIPGFGSHTMKEYSYAEIVESANLYYGRPQLRPSEKIPGTDSLKYEDPKIFYGKNNQPVGFDVVHPMGFELGNSMGYNSDVALELRKWINNLPAEYANKKLIFIGYSKGTPIAHHLVQEYADIRSRTQGIFTIGGVVQGAIPASSGLNKLMAALGVENQVELEDKIKNGQEDFLKAVSPYLSQAAGFAFSLLETPAVKGLMAAMGADVQAWVKDTHNFLKTQQMMEALKGISDMTAYSRLKWTFEHLNNKSLDRELVVFNLSALTNVQDYVTPGGYDQYGPVLPPQLTPQFGQSGVDWATLSLDNLFLHTTSIGAFEEAPGGLFDTQVAWGDTKSFPLDRRPLLHSLSETEITKLSKDVGRPLDGQVPRHQLLNRQDLEGLNFIDLGEIRGSHWDIAFRQVYKPQNVQEYYRHQFPREAYYRSILETYAVYRLLGKEGR